MYWISNLCRICAQIGDVCFPIFCKGNGDIQVKIKKCLSLEISVEDFKPKEICRSCFLKLNDFYDLINLCHASNCKFESLLYNSLQNREDKQLLFMQSIFQEPHDLGPKSVNCEEITPAVQLKDNLFDEISSSNQRTSCRYNELNNFCGVSNASGPNNVSFNENFDNEGQFDGSIVENPSVLRHSGNCNNINNCVVSISCFDSDITREKDARKNISQKIDASSTSADLGLCNTSNNGRGHANNCILQDIPPSSESVTSENISPAFDAERDFMNKSAKNSPKKLNTVCVQTIKFGLNTTNNSQSNKQKSKPNFEQNEFQDGNIKEIRHFTIAKTYACPTCNKTFKRKMTLKDHLAKHTNYRPFICQVCQKTFAVQWDLTLHSRIHTNQFQCSFCSKNFTVPSKLERHIRIHTNSRPFVCEFGDCGRRFSDKRNLEGHKLMHCDLKNYSCKTCQKSYKTKKQLKEHEISHQPDMPYRCGCCHKVYRWKANLTQHMKKHTGYKCKNCNKDIGKLSLLIKHRKECCKIVASKK